MVEPIVTTGTPGGDARSASDLDQSLRRSRSAGERKIGLFRLILVTLSFAAVLLWNLLYSAERTPTVPWIYVVQLLHMGLAAALLVLLSRDIDPAPLGYFTATADVVLATLTLALFAGGEWLGARAEVVRLFSPLLFVSFMLLSVGRHNPRNALYTGTLSCAAYVLLRSVNWTAARGEPVQEALSFLMILAGVIASWFVSREALRLAMKTAEAEEALHREQVYLLRLFESTPEAEVLLTPESHVIHANAAFLELFGYSQEEIAGRPIDELIIPGHLVEEAKGLTLTTLRGQGINVETVRQRKDGSPVDVSILGAPVFLDGEQVAIFGIYRSIGERRRKERLFEALNRAALGMLRATTEGEAFDAVATELAGMSCSLVLLQLDKEAVVLRVTHHRLEQSHLEQIEAVIGRPLLGVEVPLGAGTPYDALMERREPLYSPERSAIIRTTLPGISETAVAGLLELLAPFPSITAPLLREGKAFALLLVLARDFAIADVPAIGAFAHQLAASFIKTGLIRELEENLRELKLTQAQFLQSQKLEAVGRLAGGVAHDFNNLLTVINGYGELLLERLAEDDPRRKEADEILRAGRRAAELTGQLLAFSRRQVLRLELLDLNAVVESMRNAFLRLMGKDIELEVELDSSLPRVRADPTQMAQAFLNIALNARDAMGDGGRLTIRTSVLTPGRAFRTDHPEVQEGRYACVRVEDTGTGIPPEVLPRIFEPFFTTKEPGRGTGLGLAMVYGFVKQSGGYVYAENRAEGGARLSVYLPVAEGNEKAPERAVAAGEKRPTGTEGILLVEDDPPVLAFSRRILERAGYQVRAHASSAAALALDARLLAEVSLLVTDVVMPGMNGKALAEELEKRRPGLRVLFVSGHAEEIFSRFGIGAGGVDFLQKPYSGAELLGRVREALDA